jgi:Domain of unknown function (DUF4386)
MTQMAPPASQPRTASPDAKRCGMTRRQIAVLVGLLFISSTVTFAVGNLLIRNHFSGTAPEDSKLLLGVLLESYTGLAVAAIGLLLLPVLKPYGQKLAVAYLALRAAECIVIVAFGFYFFWSKTDFVNYDLLIYTFTGVGGIVLTILLLRSDLAPRWLSLLGGIGYAVLVIGVVSDLFGLVEFDSSIGAAFYVPGALFEIAFPLLLIFWGFGRRVSPLLEASE